MNKEIQALAAAATLAFSMLTPSTASAQSSYKNATWEDMHVGDERGYLVIKPEARLAQACTSDNHLVSMYIFATALRQDAYKISQDAAITYLSSVRNAFHAQSRSIPVSSFRVGERYPVSLPPAIFRSMENASAEFNRKNNLNVNWMVRVFMTSKQPNPHCIRLNQNSK